MNEKKSARKLRERVKTQTCIDQDNLWFFLTCCVWQLFVVCHGKWLFLVEKQNKTKQKKNLCLPSSYR